MTTKDKEEIFGACFAAGMSCAATEIVSVVRQRSEDAAARSDNYVSEALKILADNLDKVYGIQPRTNGFAPESTDSPSGEDAPTIRGLPWLE